MTERPLPALLTSLRDARAVLGVDVKADAVELRAAYRAGVRAHPPDRDPDGFLRVRGAYEVLLEPQQAIETALSAMTPHVAFPALPAPDAAAPGSAALAVLRVLAGSLPSAALLSATGLDSEGKDE